MVKRDVIETGWQGYRALLPDSAGEVQIRETRQAFFAGATVLFEFLMRHGLDEGEEPTADDEQQMQAIESELREFWRALDRRYLP